MLTKPPVKETIKHVAKSIATVLDVEILVVDKNFNIVGGTAEHQGSYRIYNNQVYQYVFKTCQPIVIENPGYHELCKKCNLFMKCSETAEIDYPIVLKNEAIGVISIVGLTIKLKEMMLSRKNDYLAFLKGMSELISSKVSEVLASEEMNMIAQKLSHIINSVNEGIIAVDKEGNVTHINKTAEKILKISKDKIIGKNINLVIPSEPIVEIIKDNIVYKDREFHIQTVDGNMIHCYISINPIVESEKDNILGAIVSVKDGRDMRKFISNIIGSYDKEVRFSDIIGESKVMVNVKQQAIRAAESFSTVLIYGESGTGKELFARAIHSESPMRKGPFIAINCAAIPETLLESELFGYEGGAFSGAKKEGKPGKFELADGGTIFLDEIGDMSLYLQAKLLRVLQDKSPLLKRIFSFENFFMERRNFKIFTEYI